MAKIDDTDRMLDELVKGKKFLRASRGAPNEEPSHAISNGSGGFIAVAICLQQCVQITRTRVRQFHNRIRVRTAYREDPSGHRIGYR